MIEKILIVAAVALPLLAGIIYVSSDAKDGLNKGAQGVADAASGATDYEKGKLKLNK